MHQQAQYLMRKKERDAYSAVDGFEIREHEVYVLEDAMVLLVWLCAVIARDTLQPKIVGGMTVAMYLRKVPRFRFRLLPWLGDEFVCLEQPISMLQLGIRRRNSLRCVFQTLSSTAQRRRLWTLYAPQKRYIGPSQARRG